MTYPPLFLPTPTGSPVYVFYPENNNLNSGTPPPFGIGHSIFQRQSLSDRPHYARPEDNPIDTNITPFVPEVTPNVFSRSTIHLLIRLNQDDYTSLSMSQLDNIFVSSNE